MWWRYNCESSLNLANSGNCSVTCSRLAIQSSHWCSARDFAEVIRDSYGASPNFASNPKPSLTNVSKAKSSVWLKGSRQCASSRTGLSTPSPATVASSSSPSSAIEPSAFKISKKEFCSSRIWRTAFTRLSYNFAAKLFKPPSSNVADASTKLTTSLRCSPCNNSLTARAIPLTSPNGSKSSSGLINSWMSSSLKILLHRFSFSFDIFSNMFHSNFAG